MYNVTVSKKGYGSVRAEVSIPEDSSGVVHDFLLPCIACSQSFFQEQLAQDSVQVSIAANSHVCLGMLLKIGLNVQEVAAHRCQDFTASNLPQTFFHRWKVHATSICDACIPVFLQGSIHLQA